jgi:hypothetical protein
MTPKQILRTVITTICLFGVWLGLLVGGPVGLSYAAAFLKRLSGV